MVWTNPLDIQYLFINVFAGSMLFAIVLFGILILILAAKFKMPSAVLAAIAVIFASFIYIIASWLIFLIIVIGGIVIYFTLGKFFQ